MSARRWQGSLTARQSRQVANQLRVARARGEMAANEVRKGRPTFIVRQMAKDAAYGYKVARQARADYLRLNRQHGTLGRPVRKSGGGTWDESLHPRDSEGKFENK